MTSRVTCFYPGCQSDLRKVINLISQKTKIIKHTRWEWHSTACIPNKKAFQIWKEMNHHILNLTSKYGLQAESTILWAFKYWPSAASVQSTKELPFKRFSKLDTNTPLWSFQLKRSCWGGIFNLKNTKHFIYIIVVIYVYSLRTLLHGMQDSTNISKLKKNEKLWMCNTKYKDQLQQQFPIENTIRS